MSSALGTWRRGIEIFASRRFDEAWLLDTGGMRGGVYRLPAGRRGGLTFRGMTEPGRRPRMRPEPMATGSRTILATTYGRRREPVAGRARGSPTRSATRTKGVIHVVDVDTSVDRESRASTRRRTRGLIDDCAQLVARWHQAPVHQRIALGPRTTLAVALSRPGGRGRRDRTGDAELRMRVSAAVLAGRDRRCSRTSTPTVRPGSSTPTGATSGEQVPTTHRSRRRHLAAPGALILAPVRTSAAGSPSGGPAVVALRSSAS